jgi:hypothetical protein
MAYQGKLRIRRVGDVVHFETMPTGSTTWTSLKVAALPVIASGYACVVSDSVAVPSATAVQLRSDL